MDVRLPDGTVIRNVPEGTTRAQLIERMSRNGMAIPAEWMAEVNAHDMKMDPTEGMSVSDLFLAGTGKALADLGRGVGQMFGLVSREEVAQSRERDAPLMKSGAGLAGNFAGNVAAVAPLTMLPFSNMIGGGLALGAGLGFLQPSTSTEETAKNVAFGGAFGAALPALAVAWRTGKASVEPFYAAGRDRIVGRALHNAAGSQGDEAMRALDEASRPFVGPQRPDWIRETMGELVPSSKPTVAEVANVPGIAALQRAAVATNPEATNSVALRQLSNNEARRAALGSLAGDDGAREIAQAALDATGDHAYRAAFRNGVPQLAPDQAANVARLMQRVPPSIIERAKDLARIKDMPLDDTTSLQGMHWVKMALDDQIGVATKSGDRTLARALSELQRDLLKGMDELSPDYAAARATFRSLAKPVNEFNTVALIRDRATPNQLTQLVQPRAFASALTDKTAQQATKFNRATLESTLSNSTRNRLDALLQDLSRSDFAQSAGRGTGSDTVQKLAYTNLLDQAGVPSFLRELSVAQIPGNLLSRGADLAYARSNRELSERLAQTMLDPAQAAELMRRATPKQRAAVQGLLASRFGLLGMSISDVPYSGLLSAPVTAGALQQW